MNKLNEAMGIFSKGNTGNSQDRLKAFLEHELGTTVTPSEPTVAKEGPADSSVPDNSALAELQLRVDVLWAILKDKLDLQESVFEEMIDKAKEEKIQAAEVSVEEKKEEVLSTQPEPTPCPKCSRIMSLKTNRCVYCG